MKGTRRTSRRQCDESLKTKLMQTQDVVAMMNAVAKPELQVEMDAVVEDPILQPGKRSKE